jgi:hypothetical protein
MELCIATTKEYNHSAARAKMTDAQVYDGLMIANNQYRQASRGEPIDCAGVGCDRKRILLHMHRCWFCGKYFCPICSREHFGDRFTDKSAGLDLERSGKSAIHSALGGNYERNR